MTATPVPSLRPGQKVKITQQIAAREYSWQTTVEGTVVRVGLRPTGSWFTHATGDRLWLDRVVLRKSDGEITTLNLDEYTHIELLD
jgi:hypothetical protein